MESKELYQERLTESNHRIVNSLVFGFDGGFWSSDFQLDTEKAELRHMPTFASGFHDKLHKILGFFWGTMRTFF